MKRSNRLVILVGVLLAVLAFVAIVILLNSRPDPVDDPDAAPTTVTVLVATRDIAIGDSVTPDLVETEEVEPAAVLETRLASPSQLSGQPALFPVPAGTQVTAELVGLGTQPRINIAAQLNPGEKAISFMVDPVTGLDFLVKPGDYIDIVLGQQIDVLQETADSIANDDPEAPPRFEVAAGLENQRTVKAILQNKRVLYVSGTKAVQDAPQDTNEDGVIDDQDLQPQDATIEYVIIVFAGTAQDAEVVKYVQNDIREYTEVSAEATRGIRTISVAIRHADDDAVEETTGITIDELVEQYGLLVPGIIEDLNEEGAGPTP